MRATLEYGADTTVTDSFGRTALDSALIKKQRGENMDEIIKILC